MTSAVYELGYLRTGVGVLETYLRSDHLFFPLNTPSPAGEPAYRRLTIGGLLLAWARLQARELPPSQKQACVSIRREINRCRSSHQVNWVRKGRQEHPSRLRQWSHYLNELQNDPGKHLDFYVSEVSVRVMIDLLLLEIGIHDNHLQEQLKGLDQLLMAIFKKGDFIWDENLSNGFHSEHFWYLWGKPVLMVRKP